MDRDDWRLTNLNLRRGNRAFSGSPVGESSTVNQLRFADSCVRDRGSMPGRCGALRTGNRSQSQIFGDAPAAGSSCSFWCQQFPLAFRWPGDTASALGGCAVVVKPHPGHPKTPTSSHQPLLTQRATAVPVGAFAMVQDTSLRSASSSSGIR